MREEKKKLNLGMMMMMMVVVVVVGMSLSNHGGKPVMILVSLHTLIGKAAFHKLMTSYPLINILRDFSLMIYLALL